MNWFEENKIIVFAIMQLINVILSTIKSVVTIKGTKWMAVLVNTIYYAFYSLIIKQITGIDNVWAIAGITAGTNLIGVWLGLTIVERLKKEELWRISTSVKAEEYKSFRQDLIDAKIKFVPYDTLWADYRVVDIFSETKQDSKAIYNIIKKHKAHYTVLKATQRLD